MNFILSDKINSGKSTFVFDLARKLVRNGFKVSGFLTPPHFDSKGKKVGQDCIILDRGSFSPTMQFTRTHPFKNSFQWRRYHFNQEAFDMSDELTTGCDLFIMDEIGPLELDDEGGFRNIMCKIIDTCDATFSVVREELKERMVNIYPSKEASIYSMSSSTSLESDLFSYLRNI